MPTIENAMIGDAQEMFNYVEQTKKLIDALIHSRDESLEGINKMGDGFHDNVYAQFYNDFEDFSKYIDELNEYNHRSIKYYENLGFLVGEWDADQGAGISNQKINIR